MAFDPSTLEELKTKISSLINVHSALLEKHRAVLTQVEVLQQEVGKKTDELGSLQKELAYLRGQMNEKQWLEKSQAETKKYIGEILLEINRYLEEKSLTLHE
jgi:SMC interacting uncharacterized protein involved in chromosome segregation